jgi:hypothetical protein
MTCAQCGRVPALFERHCLACGSDVGFPNVRFAMSQEEQNALAARVLSARKVATENGTIGTLDDFGRAVSQSRTIMVRYLTDLQRVVQQDRQLFVTYHKQVASGQRVPEQNEWDPARTAVESLIHPHYYNEISWAALSLNMLGATSYGGYHITLKEHFVAHRATVFEENPFYFCSRHQVVAGALPPAGFRATWEKRGDLAIAKLQPFITGTMQPSDFDALLLKDGAHTGDVDCIEVHIFGPIHRAAIEAVVCERPSNAADAAIWASVKGDLISLGATVMDLLPCLRCCPSYVTH